MADRRRSTSRSSPERRISSTHTNPDIFSDDFALEPLSPADGFQPSSSTADPTPQSRTPPRTPPRMNAPRSIHNSSNHESKPSNASLRKPRANNSNVGIAARNSFSLRHDAQYSDPPRRIPSLASSTSDSTNRPLSIASTFMPPRTQSPFVGNSAPSHPYAMYPQGTSINRSSTTSTIRPPERPYNGPNQPTHPYGMYAQTTAPEPDANAQSTDITTVGFPGLNQQYARRLGPDGEDADDIIGPDGHTEQLPPYTRYPDALPSKERPLADIAATPDTPLSPQSLPDHEPASASVMSTDSRAPLNGGISEAVDGREEEGGGAKEKWATRGKKRTCFGKLPVWVVALMVIALVIVAAVVGGLIGRFFGRPSKPIMPSPAGDRNSDGAATVIATLTTTLIDATPMPTVPTDLPQLPTGTFNLPMKTPTRVESGCLQNSDQNAGVWKCAEDTQMEFTVKTQDIDATQISLSAIKDDDDDKIRYGAIPPDNIPSSPVRYMLDKDSFEYGPALFFQNAYNKTVVIPDGLLNASAIAQRSADDILRVAHSLNLRDDKPKPGDKPWFCYWNETLFEGFIYVKRDTGSASTTMGAPPMPAATSTGAQNNYPPQRRSHKAKKSDMPKYPSYPKLIKIEERRRVGSPQPYCQQMWILDNWQANPAPNSEDNIIKLTEKPMPNKQRIVSSGTALFGNGDRGSGWRKRSERRHVHEHGNYAVEVEKRGADDQCHCEWMGT